MVDAVSRRPKNRLMNPWMYLPVALLLLALAGCSPIGPTIDASPDAVRPDAASPDAVPDRAPPDQPLPRPDGRSNLGAACTADHQCSSSLVCDTSAPGGSCSKKCKDHDQCGANAGCRAGWCRRLCDPRTIISTCRTDYVCQLEGVRAFCVADCRKQKCASGWACDNGSGLCINTKGGSVGAACGLKVGNCEGTPNGICIQLGTLTKGFCTLPCAAFTKPCPTKIPGAYCSVASGGMEYCVFVCDPKKPSCPHKDMSCVAQGKDSGVCLPK